MTKPRLFTYSDKSCWSPTVCSVDDAWFEGATGQPVLLKFGLGGIHKSKRSLSGLLNKLGAQPGKMSEADAAYLLALATECQKHGFALALCNFEGLRAEWHRLNSRGNAILLDLHYSKATNQEHRKNFGLKLIHELLAGDRPKADVFVVTGAPTEFHHELETRSLDPEYYKWWPIRTLPVVCKMPPKALANDLSCFARYFAQGNLESPIAELLRSLVWASNDGFTWSHPETFAEVPRELMFYSLYQEDTDSIKALFYKKGPYPIRSEVLTALLSTSGFKVSAQADFPKTIRLPRFPFGVFWVAQVADLLSLLCIRRDEKAGGDATLSRKQRLCTLQIPLNPAYSEEFVKAVEGKPRKGRITAGRNTDAYNAIKALKLREELRYKLTKVERDVLDSLVDGDSTKAPESYNVSADANNVTIQWEGIFE